MEEVAYYAMDGPYFEARNDNSSYTPRPDIDTSSVVLPCLAQADVFKNTTDEYFGLYNVTVGARIYADFSASSFTELPSQQSSLFVARPAYDDSVLAEIEAIAAQQNVTVFEEGPYTFELDDFSDLPGYASIEGQYILMPDPDAPKTFQIRFNVSVPEPIVQAFDNFYIYNWVEWMDREDWQKPPLQLACSTRLNHPYEQFVFQFNGQHSFYDYENKTAEEAIFTENLINFEDRIFTETSMYQDYDTYTDQWFNSTMYATSVCTMQLQVTPENEADVIAFFNREYDVFFSSRVYSDLNSTEPLVLPEHYADIYLESPELDLGEVTSGSEQLLIDVSFPIDSPTGGFQTLKGRFELNMDATEPDLLIMDFLTEVDDSTLSAGNAVVQYVQLSADFLGDNKLTVACAT